MNSIFHKRPAIKTKPFYLLGFTCLALAACAPDRGSTYQEGESSQALLESEGSWTIVEDQQSEMSPDQQHMMARQQVNPADIAAADTYTEDFQPADLNEDTRYRVLRLEKRVDGIDRDLRQLLPPMKKIIVPGDELNAAIADIESRHGQESPTPAITERVVKTDYIQPAPAKTLSKTPAAVTAQQASAPTAMPGSVITDIRIGEHPGKTRLVLDASGPVKFKHDVDNNEKLLLIELTGANLAAPVQKTFTNSAFLKSYTAQSNGGNVTLAVELKKPAKVLSSAALGPEGAGGHRIFLDIGAP